MSTLITEKFSSVYGPVDSWRYGRSLGIDLIGEISTCSFNCVYCQLGEIDYKTEERKIYVETTKVIQDLDKYIPFQDTDMITFSGSGEPTLASNLGEILTYLKKVTDTPTLVLTNGTTLGNIEVRKHLNLAAQVSIKLDGINQEQIKRINRPVREVTAREIQENSSKFRQEYRGKISIQTMVLVPWSQEHINQYIEIIKDIQPDEIQLNIPTRPKPLKHELDARGNHTPTNIRDYPVKVLKCVSSDVLKHIAAQIYQNTKTPVSYR
jgi:wyosine [tRNA(Phe)-imidazoG37] synthetase (radical SAM superfamily)